jgi:hypothetical protein
LESINDTWSCNHIKRFRKSTVVATQKGHVIVEVVVSKITLDCGIILFKRKVSMTDTVWFLLNTYTITS